MYAKTSNFRVRVQFAFAKILCKNHTKISKNNKKKPPQRCQSLFKEFAAAGVSSSRSRASPGTRWSTPPTTRACYALPEARGGAKQERWQQALATENAKALAVDVILNGGLTTVYLPYNEKGAVDLRDAINSMACDYLLRNKLLNPMFLSEVARDASSSAYDSRTCLFSSQGLRLGKLEYHSSYSL